MEIDTIIYYIFCAMCLGGALGVLLLRGFVNSAMSMLLSMLGVAGLMILMKAYFIGFIMITVYAGAVLVLFVFVAMLIGDKREESSFWAKIKLASLWAVLCACLAYFEPQLAISTDNAVAVRDAECAVAIAKNYGYALFTKFLLPFEIAGVLLLVAMVGVIVIARLRDEEPRSM